MSLLVLAACRPSYTSMCEIARVTDVEALVGEAPIEVGDGGALECSWTFRPSDTVPEQLFVTLLDRPPEEGDRLRPFERPLPDLPYPSG